MAPTRTTRRYALKARPPRGPDQPRGLAGPEGGSEDGQVSDEAEHGDRQAEDLRVVRALHGLTASG